MELSQQEIDCLDACFYQWGKPQMEDLRDTDLFAHYTSASVAMSIIKGSKPDERCLWLRNATVMNDFSEVEYGQSLLIESLRDHELSKDLRETCNAIHPDIIKAFEELDREFQRIKRDIWLLSLAIHRGDEQTRGKLSMWRAYGGDANVCILMKPGPFVTPQDAYDVNIAPIDYDGIDSFKNELRRQTAELKTRADYLKTVDPSIIALNLKLSLDNMIVSSKHSGFREENEWRIILKKAYHPNGNSTPSKIVDVNGTMQEVFYLPMQNVPDKGVIGAELNELLERIIIGPTANPRLVQDAFVRALKDASVTNPHDKVITCDIPLRR